MNSSDSSSSKGWFSNTKVGRLFEEEKREAVELAIKKTEKEVKLKIARELIGLLADEFIAEKMGIDIKEVEKLRKTKDV
ncbi:hypothetical protein [Caldifermentibacillus hisashii]|uniref:hypothetical protein n=1 Tax=Caldifermentibacillus hisashii TaxID=996558 RepID=UPI0034171C90